MAISLQINGSDDPLGRYVTWAPSPCVLRVTGRALLGFRGVITITNRPRRRGAAAGRLLFYRRPGDAPQRSLRLRVSRFSPTVRFWVGGDFGHPSTNDRDTAIVIARGSGRGTRTLLRVPMMVRIRKDANTLTAGERDRFVHAVARLNRQGLGPFAFFRDMHVSSASPEAHGGPGFLPWHRAYVLDLERELQAIDPSVTLPYWRFDEPAPRLFHRDFLGVSDAVGSVQFSPGNPLNLWSTDGVIGIERRPEFDTATQPATDSVGRQVLSEADTLLLGQAGGSTYSGFSVMEGNPHGRAHTSFGGFVSSIGSAPRDPLFFLLHANVDRLWAKWQWTFGRFDPADGSAFSNGSRVGHRLPDTMWPWNGVTTAPRPPTAPGGTFAQSPAAPAPGLQPRVDQMLDYQSVSTDAPALGFGYDDVPYEV